MPKSPSTEERHTEVTIEGFDLISYVYMGLDVLCKQLLLESFFWFTVAHLGFFGQSSFVRPCQCFSSEVQPIPSFITLEICCFLD
jgi:hypothetical protein